MALTQRPPIFLLICHLKPVFFFQFQPQIGYQVQMILCTIIFFFKEKK